MKFLTCLVLIPCHFALGNDAPTTPCGFEVIQLIPNVFNVIGQRLQAPVVAKDGLEAVTATTVTDNEVNFETKFTPGKIYALEITSGTYSGLVFEATAGTGSTLNVGNDLSPAVEAGTTYTLRPARTLEELFGTTKSVIHKGVDWHEADLIWIPNGVGNYDYYYLDTESNWRTYTNELALNVPVLFTEGIYIERRGPLANLVIQGEVKKAPTSVTVINGINLLNTVYPAGATLQNIGLADDMQKSAGVATSAMADRVLVPDGAGNFIVYFLNINGAWRRANPPTGFVTSPVPLPPGVAFDCKTGTKTPDLTPPSYHSGL